MNEKVERGLTVIFTGPGKGKTSAALGVAFRALGHGYRCKIIQFIKSKGNTGELALAERLAPQVEIVQMGMGFTWKKKHAPEEHREAALAGLRLAQDILEHGDCKVVVLDEILYALGKNLVTLDEIKTLISKKPPHTHLILTGRGAPPELVEMADMVTTMEATKHPYQAGIPA
ncbi:MAG: cob(I)yrinic acid a,c-diamide adenosyltransferase, partial [Nitrospinae bacterium]|nr:cob(I)yrinic acid a,c-diamide adenosyltransferase [Nitrospinota bacterium]